MKLADENNDVDRTIPREKVWIVQTPQCFRRGVLLTAHERFRGQEGITDDCMLLERAGEPVKLVEGAYTNIKVTTPEDLVLAEAFLEERDD